MQIRLAALFAGLFFSCAALSCQAAPAANAPANRDVVVDETLARIKDEYIFADKLGAIEQAVRKHQASGDYAAAADDAAFAALLTSHLQEVTHDKHMNLKYDPGARKAQTAPGMSSTAARDKTRRENYGFRKVEILPGNVGYVDILYFNSDAQAAGETVAAAMNFLSNTDALIIDLRNMRGGGTTVHLLESYFVDGTEELMQLRFRHQGTIHAMSQPYVPGKRYLGKPVYLLTSGRTFSAGEAFTYSMKSNKRATVVGATTRGGANPNMFFPIGTSFNLSVPIGESISPVTGGNWEGVGVAPDVAVDEKDALAAAHRQALRVLREASKDEALRASLDKEIAALDRP